MQNKPNSLIKFEDKHIVVVNKPFGMLSQSARDSKDAGVFEVLRTERPFLGLIQRLDRAAGGLMVLAKTPLAASELQRQQESLYLKKEYLAIAEGTPEVEEGDLRHHLKKMPKSQRMRAFDEAVSGSKEAHLWYRVLGSENGRSLVLVKPKTGRMHQIRVQLAKIGCPIVGDKKYGKTEFLLDRSICLLSHRLRFKHPARKDMMEFRATYPDYEPWSALNKYR